jgi:hypothetical protein
VIDGSFIFINEWIDVKRSHSYMMSWIDEDEWIDFKWSHSYMMSCMVEGGSMCCH